MNRPLPPSPGTSRDSDASTLPNGDRRLSAILGDVLQNTDSLVRQELELAMARLETKAETFKSDLVVATTGSAVLYAGVLGLVAACILAFARVVEPWLSALTVGLAVSGIGHFMLQRAPKRDSDQLLQSGHGGGLRTAPITRDLQETSK